MRRSPAYGPEDFVRDFDVSRETLERLKLYESLLRQWQKAVNLVSPSTLDVVWLRHFADSAQLVSFLGTAKVIADLGSGGGFPGLVIAILLANHDDRRVHLLDSNSRKCAFLSEVVRRTGVKAVVHEGRIEESAAKIGKVDAVTARALAPLAQLLAFSQPFFRSETMGVFLKGREAAAELAEAERLWSFQWKTVPSRTDSHGQIVEIRHIEPKQG